MNRTLAYLRGHRIWVVRDFVVWGSLAASEFSFLVTEVEGASKRILFLSAPLGGNLQRVEFGSLEDFRGHALPETIANPKVIPVARSAGGVVLVGREDARSFVIAKNTVEPSAVCDLVVIEME